MGTFQSPPPPPTQQPIAKVDGEVARVDPAWADWFMRFRQSAQGISLLPTPFTAGDLFFALNTTDVSLLHDVAAGNVLLSGGVGLAPAWGKVGLTTHVTGILPIANGGTNSGTGLSGTTIMISNGSAIVQGAAGTTTTVLHGNAAGSPTYSAVSLTADVTGILPVANGGTNSAGPLSGSSIMISNGSSVVQGAAGTSSTLLHGNASGAPTFSQVVLTSEVTGILPVGNGGTGTSTQFTSGSVVFAGASGIYQQDNSNFFWDSTSHFLGLGTASPAARAHLSGAISTTAWLLSGVALRVDAATYTDTTSVAGGNIAASAFAIPTFANTAGGTNTYAKASTVYIAGAPLHGTGALFTNTYPLYIESGQGRSFLGDIVDVATGYRVNGSTSTTGQLLRYDGTNFTPSSSTYPNTATRGDLLMATATNVIGNLADVATGSYLRSGGVGAIPVWSTLTLPNASSQGDLFLSTAANAMTVLAKNTTSTRYLANTGTSNNPAWDQVSLTTGISGILPIANGGTGVTLAATGGTSQVLQQTSVGATITVGQLAASNLSNGTTGSGSVVLATSPTLTTAVLGSSTATTQSPNDNSTKVATTAYVDTAVLGQDFKEACKYGTTTALPTVVYANGSSGVGATLTAAAFGALSFDGSTPSVNDRVLIKNQVSTFQNGIYTVTVVGAVATLFVLTRATDFNQSFEIKTGDSTFITSGSTLSTTTWAVNSADSPTMGTDPITFVQVAGQGSFIAGNGITITGTTVSVSQMQLSSIMAFAAAHG